MSADPDLKRKTFVATVWSVIRSAWGSVATLVLFIVMARLLGPRDFGLFALASVMVEVARTLAAAGLGDAVIRRKDLDASFLDTAFWATMALSVLMGAAMFLLAPLYAQFMQEPELTLVLQVLAFTLPLGSLGAIHGARLAREFKHSRLAMLAIATSLVSSGIAVILAWQGLGIWALVAQAATGSLLTTLFAWWYMPWVPGLRFRASLIRELASFSISMSLTQLLWMLLVRIQDVFIGRWYGSEAVGTYRVAWRMIELVAQSFLSPLAGVSLVTFANLQDDKPRLAAVYSRVVGTASLITFPMLLGFGAVSDIAIPLVFGPEWWSAAPVAQALTLMVIPFVFNFFAGPALTAVNRPQAVLMVAAFQVVTMLLLTWLLVPYGLVAVAVAYVVRAYLTMPLQQYNLFKHTGTTFPSVVRAVWPALASATLMAIAVRLAVLELLAVYGISWTSALTAVIFGALVYTALIILLGRGQLRQIGDVIASVMARRGSTT
ncbi:MAG: lipopolysaccharide biosynthesis protein [Hyphomicrobiales bacterium]|nr:MAG: lipopolysaccharide biosynthesis protein [Hyphomicrobiales bacterium]